MLKSNYLLTKGNFLFTFISFSLVGFVNVLRASELFVSFFVFGSLIEQGFAISQWDTKLIGSLTAFVLILVFDPILVTIFNYTMRVLSARISKQFKINLYNSVYSITFSESKKYSKEQFLNMATTDFPQYFSGLLQYIMFFSSASTAVVAAIVFAALINPILLALFLVTSFILLLLSYFSNVMQTKINIKKSRLNEVFLTKINKKFENFIMYINSGYKIPFISGALEIIGIRNQKYNTQNNKKVLVGIPQLVINGFAALAIFGVLWWVFKGTPDSAQVAIIIIGVTQFRRFHNLFSEIDTVLSSRNQYKQYYKKINEIYGKMQNENDVKFKDKLSSISLENVSVVFEEKEIIKNLNLTINKGDKLLIFGKSGTGKSTIISMLLNELKPNHGKLLINEKEAKNNLTISNNISFANNENFIIDGTLEENIAFSTQKNVDKDKISFLKKTLFIDYVTDENSNITTLDLSEGQKQKIVLARALYQDKDWLVLDEAISNIDIKTKKSFEELLNKLDKTVIFISHTKLEKENKIFNKKLLFNEETGNWILKK